MGCGAASPAAAFLVFMFIGGCAGSTSCGIKVFRYQVLFQTARMQINRVWQPHAVVVPSYNGRPIPDSVMDAVMTFVFVFALVFGVLTAALTLMGLDFMTAISGAGTAIANVGPGLGEVIGPGGTFAPPARRGEVDVGGGHASRTARTADGAGAVQPGVLARLNEP